MILPNSPIVRNVVILSFLFLAFKAYKDIYKLKNNLNIDGFTKNKWTKLKLMQIFSTVAGTACGIVMNNYDYYLMSFFILTIIFSSIAVLIEDSYTKFRRLSNIEGIKFSPAEAQVDKELNKMTREKWILIVACLLGALFFIFVVAGVRF